MNLSLLQIFKRSFPLGIVTPQVPNAVGMESAVTGMGKLPHLMLHMQASLAHFPPLLGLLLN